MTTADFDRAMRRLAHWWYLESHPRKKHYRSRYLRSGGVKR